ncbi:Glyoxalase/Bleomycin resistance protein/Dihydroxybiphenyl dioxygenase [Crepidotus variabilis]|uniref:Glyoxalase/Bleomycin resistance protein/Dihydroxybiphenyl dioxygenase n=1 Tax=Crepidotus variabilis TaxID=179855 RepID=A0A9P6EI55_9AGAR|nr:Glyoxalase/Bleomycin resistance protein/Dihydroxybiphenyl dioxygenase [Crepidotus variabilis]
MSIQHISLNVSDISKARKFYLAALKPLGYRVFMEFYEGKVLGMGPLTCGPVFWLASCDAPTAHGSDKRHGKDFDFEKESAIQKPRDVTGPLHIAFSASNRQKVREFYEAAIAAGGKCNGPPGLRPEYFMTNYSAYVLDPDGRNIEAICMKPAFWAEPWGALGWGLIGVLGGTGGGLVARYMGWL